MREKGARERPVVESAEWARMREPRTTALLASSSMRRSGQPWPRGISLRGLYNVPPRLHRQGFQLVRGEQELVDIWKQVFAAELDHGEPIGELRESVRDLHQRNPRAQKERFRVPQYLWHEYIEAQVSYQKHARSRVVPMEDLQLRALDELEQERDATERGMQE